MADKIWCNLNGSECGQTGSSLVRDYPELFINYPSKNHPDNKAKNAVVCIFDGGFPRFDIAENGISYSSIEKLQGPTPF